MGGFYVGECPRISPFFKKQWASAPLFLRNGELLGHSPIRNTFNHIPFLLKLEQ
jgi:hypothetical protein